MSKIVKNWEFPFFVLKMIEYFGNSHVFFTLATKKVLILGDFLMKNVVKIFGIPMSSLGGVHLISGIAQSEKMKIELDQLETHFAWLHHICFVP